MTPVAIKFVDKSNLFPEGGTKPAAGNACWSSGDDHLLFVCPCGCGQHISLPVKPAIATGWDWNGSKDKPTLRPSIRRLDGCLWHGYLTEGVFTSC